MTETDDSEWHDDFDGDGNRGCQLSAKYPGIQRCWYGGGGAFDWAYDVVEDFGPSLAVYSLDEAIARYREIHPPEDESEPEPEAGPLWTPTSTFIVEGA